MNISRILKLILIAEIILLLSNALTISRDYQDSWILEGLEIPFVLFVATYPVVFFSERKIKWMVALATLSRCILFLIPGLKYVWFLGRSVDQHQQYLLANFVCNQGQLVPSQYLGGGLEMYTTTPGIHLFFANFSIITGIPLLYSFKFLPIILTALYPLLTYVIVGELGLSKKTKVLKYALFLSSLLFVPGLSYLATGSMFGVILSFFVFVQIIKLIRISGRSHLMLLLVFTFGLVITHSFSAMLIAVLMLGILIVQRFSFLGVKSFVSRRLVSFVLLLNIGWLLFRASNTLSYMIDQILGIGLLEGVSPETGYIPFRFFQLLSTDIFEAMKTLLALRGVGLFFLLLTVAGLVVVAMKGLRSNTLRFLSVANIFILLSLLAGLGLGLGGFYLNRVIRFPAISCAAFFGIFIAYIERTRLRSIVAILSLVAIVTFAPLGFACQPLISSANVLSSNLPANEPIVYVVQVNSVYQTNMIKFAEHHVLGRIASDGVTRNQIIGLTDINFSTQYLAWFYPLSASKRSEDSSPYYDYFFIHLPGKSGAFEEQAETRTRNVILATLNNLTYNVVYSNEHSYILHRTSST